MAENDQNPPAPPAAPSGPSHFRTTSHVDVVRAGKGGAKQTKTYAPETLVPAKDLTPEEIESLKQQGAIEPIHVPPAAAE